MAYAWPKQGHRHRGPRRRIQCNLPYNTRIDEGRCGLFSPLNCQIFQAASEILDSMGSIFLSDMEDGEEPASAEVTGSIQMLLKSA